MKRFISVICCCFVALSSFCHGVYGLSEEDNSPPGQVQVSETVELLENGASIVTTIYEDTVTSRSNLYNKSGTKVMNYKDQNGTILWSLAVTGEFRILEGASVTCISASCSSEVFEDAWSCARKTANTSGSWAIANGEFEQKILGIVVNRKSVEVRLTCDVYGNLS